MDPVGHQSRPWRVLFHTDRELKKNENIEQQNKEPQNFEGEKDLLKYS